MGLGKWWLTHGPGSPGAVAKAMAMSYSKIRTANWRLAKAEIMLSTIRTRYSESELSKEAALSMINSSEGKLAKLIWEIFMFENAQKCVGAMLHAPNVLTEMLFVIDEVTEQYAPGA